MLRTALEGTLRTVYRMTPEGVQTVLYSFAADPDGHTPAAGLSSSRDGYLYGVTFYGGAPPPLPLHRNVDLTPHVRRPQSIRFVAESPQRATCDLAAVRVQARLASAEDQQCGG